MAGLGRKVWSAGDVLSAANLNGYVADQVVQVYAGTAARSSALNGSATEGMVTYLADFNLLDFFDGSSYTGINYRTVTSATATANTAVLGWANELVLASNASAMTVTVPDVFQVGQGFEVIREGAGTVVLAAGTGVTSWAGAGTAGTAVTFKIDQQYNGAQIIKTAANSYRVIGKVAV
jgi:hypothetical protein